MPNLERLEQGVRILKEVRDAKKPMPKPDMGMVITAVAREITPTQLAELLAIKIFSMCPVRCPTLRANYSDPDLRPLVTLKLIKRAKADGFGAKWCVTQITELGERVLLHVAEDAMIATGKMAPLEEVCPE